MDFKVEIKQSVNGEEIKIIGDKIIYNSDDEEKEAKKWIREGIPTTGVIDCPQLSSAIKVKQTGNGKMLPNSFGYYYNVSNDVGSACQSTVITTSGFSCNANGCSILPNNLPNIVCMFSARKLISQNWINDKDQFLTPNKIETDEYANFFYDSLIYSLYNTSSHQSSLRKILYKEKEYDIKNEFFFMSKETIVELADAHSNCFCYNDAYNDKERFVYIVIKNIEKDNLFSKEAQEVLDLSRELLINSFKYRESFNNSKPEFQINNWDCGWYQIKGLINWVIDNKFDENIMKKYNEFKENYKALSDKMRPKVYELGFLKK